MSDEEPLPTGLQLTALDPVFREHPHDYLDRLRADDPVHSDWVLRRLFLTRFEDVRAVLSNRSLSVDPRKAPDASRRHATLGDLPPEVFQPSMLRLDDPDHKRLRGLVSQAFNQRSVDAWRPRIRAIAEALLDALADREWFDVIAEFAAPLPIVVIAEMLGVDPGDMPQFKRWSDARSHLFNPGRTPQQAEALAVTGRELNDYFARVVEARRRRRGADLISMLVAAEEAGDRLSAGEIVTTCNLLLVAGNLTTTDLIGNGILALLRGIPISSPSSARMPNSCPMRSRRCCATTPLRCRPVGLRWTCSRSAGGRCKRVRRSRARFSRQGMTPRGTATRTVST